MAEEKLGLTFIRTEGRDPSFFKDFGQFFKMMTGKNPSLWNVTTRGFNFISTEEEAKTLLAAEDIAQRAPEIRKAREEAEAQRRRAPGRTQTILTRRE